jgi:hypothetical protein
MNTDLAAYCVMGDFIEPTGTATITGMGVNFAANLESHDNATKMATSYPAAVLVGVIVSLSSQLRHAWAPIQSAGDFAAEVNRVVRYRAAVLPFCNGTRAPRHWLGLASWTVASSAEAIAGRH